MKPVRIEPTTYQVVTDHHFTMTEDDVFDGKNILGMDVRHVPLDVPLCKGCDNEIDRGICDGCQLIHADLVPLTEVHSDPFLGRAA